MSSLDQLKEKVLEEAIHWRETDGALFEFSEASGNLTIAVAEYLAVRDGLMNMTDAVPKDWQEAGETHDNAHTLIQIAQDLDDARRTGSDEDIPEGTRNITLSDTLTGRMSTNLRRIAKTVHK